MEIDPVFDAGTGSVLNEDGDVEMDAFIMNGVDLEAGSVIGVNRIQHPVKLARYVMERTEHIAFAVCLLARMSNICEHVQYM